MRLDKISGDEVSCQIYQAKSQPVNLDRKAIPWKGEPSPLVNLLDMIKFCADKFLTLMSELEELVSGLYADSSRTDFDGDEWEQTGELLDRASNWCSLLELTASAELINHILSRRQLWHIRSLNEARESMKMLQNIIEAELSKRLFMFVPQNQAQWYEKKDGFGKPVSDAFPSAIEDIKEAGNCYATERYTACVFHSMRVLEHGLKALAKDVRLIFYRQSWGTIIKKTKDKIDLEIKSLSGQQKDPARTERLQFLSKAAQEFTYFKDGWRNYVMHGEEIYDESQALSVLNHVSAFMAHLSTKLKE